jgi:CHASE2 domain-containing sensor protein
VEIDDATFWHPPLSGMLPTNRRFLADLARAAAQSGATVVALDFKLQSPFSRPGDDEIRRRDNEYLLSTIRDITNESRLRLVLGCGLSLSGEGQWNRIPSIFDDSVLPKGVVVGYTNMPLDPRLIPPRIYAWDWDGTSQRNVDSFAFQIANAYGPLVGQDATIKRTILSGQPVYGGFLRDSAFLKIPAWNLLRQTDQFRNELRNRIVIIGGTWHQDGEGRGPLIDGFLSPVGIQPGLYMNANFVEALIDHRFAAGVSKWVIASVVVSLAAMLSLLFFWVKSLRYRLAIFAFFLSAWLISYVSLFFMGRYLDFTIPVTLCFFQLFLACFEGVRRFAVAKLENQPGAPPFVF